MGKVIDFCKKLEERRNARVFVNDDGDEVTMPVNFLTRTLFTMEEIELMQWQLAALSMSQEYAMIGDLLAECAEGGCLPLELRHRWTVRDLMQRLSRSWAVTERARLKQL